jgi:small multidrug resistance family-3 protein
LRIRIKNILYSLFFFFIAGLCEIGGGYLVWLWLRKKKRLSFGLIGGVILFVYGIIPTLQPSNFGRVYATYGGIFVVMAIIWGLLIDRKDRTDMKLLVE